MEEYVKLQDIYDLIDKMYKEPRYQHDDEDYYSGVAQVASMLADIDTREIEEPREAVWISQPWTYDGFKYMCSKCTKGSDLPFKYCPHCCATMKFQEVD